MFFVIGVVSSFSLQAWWFLWFAFYFIELIRSVVGTAIPINLHGHLDFEVRSVKLVIGIIVSFSLHLWWSFWLALWFCLTCKPGSYCGLIVILFSLQA